MIILGIYEERNELTWGDVVGRVTLSTTIDNSKELLTLVYAFKTVQS